MHKSAQALLGAAVLAALAVQPVTAADLGGSSVVDDAFDRALALADYPTVVERITYGPAGEVREPMTVEAARASLDALLLPAPAGGASGPDAGTGEAPGPCTVGMMAISLGTTRPLVVDAGPGALRCYSLQSRVAAISATNNLIAVGWAQDWLMNAPGSYVFGTDMQSAGDMYLFTFAFGPYYLVYGLGSGAVAIE